MSAKPRRAACVPLTVVGMVVSLGLLPAGSVLAQSEPERQPVPAEEDLNRALSIVKDIYGKEYALAKTDQQKSELAKRILQAGVNTQGDPAGQFALLKVARGMAAQAGDLQTALRAADDMARVFEIDGLQEKTDLLAKSVKSGARGEGAKALITSALGLLDEAIGADRYELAQRLGETALSLARSTRQPTQIKEIVARNKQVEKLAEVFAEVQTALASLEEKPTDPAANLAVGRFRCFVKGDWAGGLPMLALGDDATLKAVAAKELAEPSTPSEQVELADTWWEAAKTATDAHQAAVKAHAATWYAKAIPGLDGLTRKKAEQRTAVVSSDPRSVPAVSAGRMHPVLGYELQRHPADAVSFGGHWYRLCSGKIRWSEAQIRCQEMGGYLACAETPAEYAALLRVATTRPVWLGAGKRAPREWVWLTGGRVDPALWAKGQPDNHKGKENRACMNPHGRLNDTPDSHTYIRGFICEWEF